jgi:hypothetical protein
MGKLLGPMFAAIFTLFLIGLISSKTFGPTECFAGELTPLILLGTPLPLVTAGKSDSDLDGATKPEPQVDSAGRWVWMWDAGMYISKDLLDGRVS